MSYDLKTNYYAGIPVSAVDLNRRADVLNAQLPGAMRLAGVRPGVIPLLDSPSEFATTTEASLIAILGAGSDALQVKNERVQPGAALVESDDGMLVYVVLRASMPLPTREEGEAYLHIALRRPVGSLESGVPIEIGGPLDMREADSRRGGAPFLLTSDSSNEPHALLLAQWIEGAWVDKRTWVAPVELARALVKLQGDLAALTVRVATLETGGGNGSGHTSGTYLSQLLYSSEDMRKATAVIEGRLADLEAKIAVLQKGNDLFPAPFDLLADEIALNRAGIAEVNPHAIERGQISVVVKQAGHGQDDTPDYTPDTGAALELPYDPETGVFGL